MAKKKRRAGPAHNPSGHLERHDHLVVEVKQFVERYSWHIVSLALAAAIIFLVVTIYLNRARSDERESWDRLNALMTRSPADENYEPVIAGCKEILDNHWKTSATPWVLLHLGDAELTAGKPDDA